MTLQKADCCTESLTHHIVTSYYFVILSVFTSPYVCNIFAYRCTAYNLWEVAESPCHLTGLDSWRRSRLSIEFLRCLVNFFMIHLFHKRTEKIWKDMWKKHAKQLKNMRKTETLKENRNVKQQRPMDFLRFLVDFPSCGFLVMTWKPSCWLIIIVTWDLDTERIFWSKTTSFAQNIYVVLC